MVENNKTEVITQNNNKIGGLTIAAMVLGIVSLALWCVWFISIPCAILALIFGIISIKKPGKGMAITAIITSSIAIALWVIILAFAFIGGFISGMEDSLNTSRYSYYERY